MKELELKVLSLGRAVMKYGKYIEELEKEVADLKGNSHPPIFTKEDYSKILERLDKIENKE